MEFARRLSAGLAARGLLSCVLAAGLGLLSQAPASSAAQRGPQPAATASAPATVTAPATAIAPTAATASATAPAMAAAPATAPAPARKLARSQSDSRLGQIYASHVNALTDPAFEGRGAATKGVVKARDYVIDQFEGIGLKGAFGGSYTQGFDVRLGVATAAQSLEVTGGDSKPLATLQAGDDFDALTLSGSGTASGQLVFCGYGIVAPARKYDSYAKLPKDGLKGKIAVLLRYEPQDERGVSLWSAVGWSEQSALAAKVSEARRRGAVGVVIVNPPAHSEDAFARSGRSGGSLPAMRLSVDAFAKLLAAGVEGDEPLIKLQQAADKGSVVRELKGVTAKLQVEMKPLVTTLHNVAAVLPGSGKLANQYIVVGGHYDHIGMYEWRGVRHVYFGADDNASGASGVLLLARTMAGRLASGVDDDGNKLPADRRTIVFAAFGGEEIGLVGSSAMARNLKDLRIQRSQLVAMLNFDMIGRLDKTLSIYGTATGDRWGELIKPLADKCDFEVWRGGGGNGPSDYASFNAIDVPVLMFFTGVHRDMHRESDTPDKINVDGAVKIMALAQRVLLAAASQERAIAYVKPRSGRRPFLGIEFDREVDGQAALVVRVVKAGPADAAGVKAKDVLLTVGGAKVASLADVVEALMKHQPADSVAVVVKRAGKEVRLNVTLGEMK